MNATSKLIGRLTVLLVAVGILIGVSGGLARAEPIDIDSGPMLVARGLCAASGGDWELTNGIFYCYNSKDHFNGHGWACDMTVSPPVCWSFMKVHTGGIRVNIGGAQIAIAQVAPSPADQANLSAVQAQIAQAQVSSVSGTSGTTGTKVAVNRAGAVAAGGVIAKTTAP